jgi:MarR family transcriptional regulator, lower aerobic nicotinate degradation pathway regulator
MGLTNVGSPNITNRWWYPQSCYDHSLLPEQPSPQVPAPARIRERPTWLISRTYARAHALLTEGFAASGTGLRSYHYRLLAALDEWGPASQADLARRTGVDRSDVVTVLGQLEPRRLIKRSVDPSNRRRNVVSITRAGRKQLQALDSTLDDIQEAFLAPLSLSERRHLMKLLRKVVDSG